MHSFISESNVINRQDDGNEGESGSNLSPNEDDYIEIDELFGDDDTDTDKNYEPSSSESDSSDGLPRLNQLQKKVSQNKSRPNYYKTNTNEQHLQTEILEEDLYLTSDDENIAENEVGLGPIQETCSVKRKVKNKPKSAQIGRKRVVNASEWACNVRKRKYAGGKEYVSKKGKIVHARVLKPPCTCRMKCSDKLFEHDRQEIFNSYWSENKTMDTKRQFIASCVEKNSIDRSRKRAPNSNRNRENTLSYFFTVNSERIKVCKVMFLNTLSISNMVVVNVLKKMKQVELLKPTQGVNIHQLTKRVRKPLKVLWTTSLLSHIMKAIIPGKEAI